MRLRSTSAFRHPLFAILFASSAAALNCGGGGSDEPSPQADAALESGKADAQTDAGKRDTGKSDTGIASETGSSGAGGRGETGGQDTGGSAGDTTEAGTGGAAGDSSEAGVAGAAGDTTEAGTGGAGGNNTEAGVGGSNTPDAGPDVSNTNDASDGASDDGGGDVSVATEAGSDSAPEAGVPQLSVLPTSVNFGLADCGGSVPRNTTVQLQNVGSAPLTYSAAITPATAFAITAGATGTLAPGDSAVVTLAAEAIDRSATAGATINGTLTVTMGDQDPTIVPVQITPSGATLQLVPTSASFGQVALNTAAAAIPLTLTNTGNQAVNVTVGASQDAQFSLTHNAAPSAVALAAGSALPGLSAGFTPTATALANTTAALNVVGAVCGNSIAAIPLSGQGTIGSATVSGDLAFGQVNCGTSAAAQNVTIGNAGNQAFTYTAVLTKAGSSPYTVSSASGSVAAGGNAVLAITPKPIPQPSPVPGDYSDVLTITTNIPNDPPHIVNLSEAASGAVLSFSKSSIPFGSVPVGTSQNAPFDVVNTGNAPAHVTLSASNAAFGVTPSVSSTVANGAPIGATASYGPSDISTSTGTIAMTVAAGDVLCAALPAELAVSGTGQNGGTSLDTNSIDFGNTACNTTASSRTFSITNTGNAPMQWSAGLGKNPSPYALSSGSGTLAAGASVAITVTPSKIPATSSVQQDLYADTVTVTTNVYGDTPHTVALHQTAQGAILAFSPTTLDFGNVPVGSSSNGSFNVVNTGNAGANAMLSSDDAHFTVPTTAQQIASQSSPSSTATFAPGTSSGPLSGHVSLQTSDTLCAPLPTAILLTGTGITGNVAYSPSSLNFGNVDCGTTATSQQIVFTNTGNASYKITPTFGKATPPYTFTMVPASGVVPPNGGTATITVKPKAIPATSAVPGDYGDTLTVTTNVVGDSPHAIALTQSARGAIVTVATRAVNFSTTSVGATSNYQLAVTNSGNMPVQINYNTISNPVFSLDQNQTVQPGSSGLANYYFTPTAAQQFQGAANFAVPAGTVLCAALPGNLTLTGTGTNVSTAKISPTTIALGKIDCGTAATQRPITIQNVGNSPFTWSASFQSTNGSAGKFYTLDAASGTVAAGATTTINLVPAVMPNNTDLNVTTYNDVLTLTTTAPSDSPHTINITEAPQGAILNWETSYFVVPRNGGVQYDRVYNYGNVSGIVDLTVTGSNKFSVTPTSVQVYSNSTTGQTRWAIINNATAAGAINATISMSTTAPLCMPLPTPMTVSGN